MRRLTLGAVVLFAVICYGETPVRTCECTSAWAGPACQAAWDVDAVFVGRVKEAKDLSPLGDARFHIQVLEAFRGVSTAEVVVATGAGINCGIYLPAGSTFLVYARRDETGMLWTSYCTRTARLENAAADLAYLRAIGQQPTGAGKIQGDVFQLDPGENGQYRYEPLGGVRVVASALPPRKQVLESRTQSDGSFAITALPGRYDVKAEVRFGLFAHQKTVELKDVRGCVAARFQVQSDGRISGRVVDAHGSAVPHLQIDLVSDSRRRQGSSFTLSDGAITNDLGRFEFIHLQPDSYVVGVQQTYSFREGRNIRFASAPDRAEDLIKVGNEARVDIGDFRLPESVELARLSGVVRDPSGQPVAGARVYLGLVSGPHVTDKQGVFQITTIAGREYTLFATAPDHAYAHNSRSVESPRFIASSSLPPFDLRFNR